MRNIFTLIVALFIFSSFNSKGNIADPHGGNTKSFIDSVQKPVFSSDKIASMKTKDAERILGRKLSLKEKISFKLAQYKIKKAQKATGEKSKGQTAFVLSLIGLCILFVPYLSIAAIPLAIIGIVQGSQAKKENPNDRKAQTAIILGIVTLGLIALALILVILIIAAWSGGW